MTKAIILAGGLGTRISEETSLKPKPMIEVGGMPILWHIMKLYSYYGINDFIICCGYKGYMIKEYFNNYFLHNSDITFDMKSNKMHVHEKHAEPWVITLVDTGQTSMTGGRIKKIEKYIDPVKDKYFCLTYGDGLSDIDINKLIEFHKKSKVKATVSATIPPGRFGVLDIEGNMVVNFREKHDVDEGRINGGFFVLSPEIFKYIKNEHTIWEKGPLESLAIENNLAAYRHDGFWQPMDTLRDKILLEELWQSGNPPWKKWD